MMGVDVKDDRREDSQREQYDRHDEMSYRPSDGALNNPALAEGVPQPDQHEKTTYDRISLRDEQEAEIPNVVALPAVQRVKGINDSSARDNEDEANGRMDHTLHGAHGDRLGLRTSLANPTDQPTAMHKSESARK